jgi:uncharacterized protein
VRLLLIACLVVLPVSQLAGFPRPSGHVNDFASVLEEADESYLESFLEDLKRETSAQVVVVTVPSLERMTIEEYAHRLFRDWGIGDAQRDDGILILVAPLDRSVRIEVGYGLEGILPDGLAGEIIRTAMLPEFRAGNLPRGIGRGIDRISRILRGERATAPPATVQTDPDTPHPAFVIPFIGLFVGLGAFAAGVGVGAKTFGPLIWGVGFAGIPMAMALLSLPGLVPAIMVPLGLAALVFGVRNGRSASWAATLRGRRSSPGTSDDSSRWVMGGGSGSSEHGSSDGGASSSGSFGGGSSGGGGASGRW